MSDTEAPVEVQEDFEVVEEFTPVVLATPIPEEVQQAQTEIKLFNKWSFEEVEVKVSRAKLDEKGNKVTELAKSKNGNEYLKVVRETTTEKRKKDMPSKLNARRKIMRNVNKVKDADGKNVDIPTKLFDEIAPKYKDVKGGYTRIIKKGQRRGDAAETVILELI